MTDEACGCDCFPCRTDDRHNCGRSECEGSEAPRAVRGDFRRDGVNAFDLVFEGKPVAWDRTARGRDGKQHNRRRQVFHRRLLAKAMQFAEGRRAFDGPVKLSVVFDYRRNETTIRIEECSLVLYDRAHRKGGGKTARADIDNLVKQVMEAAEAAGIVANDVQFVSITAEKFG